MQKIDISLQIMIAEEYLKGTKYREIQEMFQVNRWDIQNALSKFNIKTNRIKSPPRLPGGKNKKPGRLMDRYHDGDLLPPMKTNTYDPVREADLDIMERKDNCEDTNEFIADNDFVKERGSCEIVIDDLDNVRDRKSVV